VSANRLSVAAASLQVSDTGRAALPGARFRVRFRMLKLHAGGATARRRVLWLVARFEPDDPE